MAVPQASSRLEILQARFQQKQLQEKELKLLQLYDQQQQRAHQVAQRGSAGSNGSTRGSMINHPIITTISSTSHVTSNQFNGKVRQMFDERRQTTVKGIDRSYPLEPLENKPRKQADCNGGAVQKDSSTLTMSRRSDTVKCIEHENMNNDANSSPSIVSYHEEITCKPLGSRMHHQSDEEEEELGNINRITQYTNGNHCKATDKIKTDEIIDQDIIGRNRLMAKIHLMSFDQNLKYRIKNDLENEQFPEDLMIDVPDKLPDRVHNKKLSQAEARLQRFKNANARRNNISKDTNSTKTTAKKHLEPMFPAKPNSRLTKGSNLDSTMGKIANTNVRVTVKKSVPSATSKSADITTRTFTETKIEETKPIRKKAAIKSTDVVDTGRSSVQLAHSSASENAPHLRDFDKTNNEIGSSVTDTDKEFIIETKKTSVNENNVAQPQKSHPRRQSMEKEKTPRVTPTRSTSATSPTPNSTKDSVVNAKGKMAAKLRTSNSTSPKGGSPIKNGPNVPVQDNLVPCKICGRYFADDRVSLHQQICAKTVQKKRKQFDATMHRVKGTELEPFVRKGQGRKQPESKSKKPEVKSNWRKKHEEFISAIRSAKQVQAHLAAGGKLSDLPPPPVSDTSDYIQCPHCSRKFNQAAAERHIPKCQHMLHNKPLHARVPSKSKH